MSKWYGIDVSDNQGVINWGRVKSAGCQFAILRSVRRSGKTDNQFVNNLLGCRAQGIPVSVYKYTYATSQAAAQEEARQVVELLQAHALDCKVWWDVEDRPTLAGLGRENLTNIIRAAREVIEAAGYQFCMYSGQYVIKEAWYDWTAFQDCPWWVARYPLDDDGLTLRDVPEHMPPDVPMRLNGWQWTSKGRIAGINGNVDMDIMYQDPGQVLETQAKELYKVRVTIDNLIIRSGPGTNYDRAGGYTGKGVFTIIEESAGQGSSAGWGKLKSGRGWISLDYCEKI